MDSIQFEWDYLILLIGALVPFATALVRKIGTPDWQSGILTIVFATLAATLNHLVDVGSDNWTWELVAGDSLQIWFTALATWLGLTEQAVNKVFLSTKGFLGKVPEVVEVAAAEAQTEVQPQEPAPIPPEQLQGA